MSFTVNAYNIMLDHEFRNIPTSFYNNLYVGLSLSEIDNYGNGVTEPSDPLYARAIIPRNNGSWSDYIDNQKTLIIPITFPRSSKIWGNIIEIFISMNSEINSEGTSSSILYHQKLSPLVYVGKNTKLTIPEGTIYIKVGKEV